jgi:hypothetical protein
LSYAWSFGDGASGVGSSVSHAYSTAGTYTATANVSDGKGGSVQSSVTVTVNTTPPPPPTKALHVSGIAMSLSSAGGNSGKSASARVTVVDSAGAAISGATVSGNWSGLTSSSVSGATGANGAITFVSGRTKQTGTFTFTVTSIAAAGFTYDRASNATTSGSISTSGVASALSAAPAVVALDVETFVGPLTVTGLNAVILTAEGNDRCSFTATLDGQLSGSILGIDVGGVQANFRLDASGRAGEGSSTCSLKSRNGLTTVKFDLRDSFAQAWQDDGVDLASDHSHVALNLPVTMTLGSSSFTTSVTTEISSKAGRARLKQK